MNDLIKQMPTRAFFQHD